MFQYWFNSFCSIKAEGHRERYSNTKTGLSGLCYFSLVGVHTQGALPCLISLRSFVGRNVFKLQMLVAISCFVATQWETKRSNLGIVLSDYSRSRNKHTRIFVRLWHITRIQEFVLVTFHSCSVLTNRRKEKKRKKIKKRGKKEERKSTDVNDV